MKNHLVFCIIFSLSLFSCKNTKKEQQSAQDETKKQDLVASENRNASTSSTIATEPKTLSQKPKLHKSISSFGRNIHIVKTKKFLIRIDEMNDGSNRYASWAIGSDMSQKPDLIINNGEYVREGTGGNHSFIFKNKEYEYNCDFNVLAEDGVPDAYLRVLKNGKEILKQDGTVVKATETNNSVSSNPALDPSSPNYNETFGEMLLAEESFGNIKIGTLIKDIIQLLGKPEKVEAPFLSDATGEYMGAINYPSKGIKLGTNGKNESDQTVNMIFISSPCTLKTSKNIGIGSTKEALVSAYQPHLKPEQYQDKAEMILGSLYGGMIVNFKNEKVSEMSLGVFAE